MKHFVTTISLQTSTLAGRFGARLFSVATDETGSLVATGFGDAESLESRARLGELVPDSRRTQAAVAETLAYFAGELKTFSLSLAPVGSDFQHRVWQKLREIPFGQTRSYGELAKELKSSPRAVGRANATNPICLIVPCHRVIGADGSLTGFAFGEALKQRLLDHESEFARAAVNT